MDLFSYQLGKKSGGGSSTLITKTITANGNYSATDDEADGYSSVSVSVPASGIYDYISKKPVANNNTAINLIEALPEIDFTNITSMYKSFTGCGVLNTITLTNTGNVDNMFNCFANCSALENINLFDTSRVENMTQAFNGCSSLTTLPAFDTSKVKLFNFTFADCTKLTNLPLLDTSSVTSMNYMFQNCGLFLTDQSIDNILQMCINATNYTGTKTLSQLGFVNGKVSATKIQSLPHYQDFINAGWTIGY